VREGTDGMSDYWFKPKTHGYGATPIGWKGWALTLGLPVVLALAALPLMILPALAGELSALRVAIWVVVNAVAVFGFMRVCRVKTDGEWRWRWNEK